MTRLLVIITIPLLFAVDPSTADVPVAEYQLGGGLTADVAADGSLSLRITHGAETVTVLQCLWPNVADPRLQDPPRVFQACAREGDVHGRRGFNDTADDDGDGDVDEDPLDGEDNDRDGAVDEDFAAVSHAMAAWHWRHGARVRHLETYHWSYPHLAGLVAAVYSTPSGATPEPLQITVTGGRWLRTDEFCRQADAAADGPSFVARIPGSGLWIGLAVLDAAPRRLTSERVRVEKGFLAVPLLDGRQALAVAAAPTRLRVMHDLAAAVRIHDGAEDPVSGQRVAWLPPAVPPAVPEANLPEAVLRPDALGGFDVELTYGDTPHLDCDPDLFVLDGEPLGEAAGLAWQATAAGEPSRLDWPQDGRGGGDPCHPYAELAATGAGVMAIRFAAPPPTVAATLEATLADGRHVTLPVTLTEPPVAPVVTASDSPAGDHDQLQLSPLLLNNYPNPFRVSTRVSYRIPATAGEAFVWEREGDPPFDPRQRLAMTAGTASVSVTVYDLEGRVIATLYDGILGEGTYHASWDGRDTLGRIMASGAYFCKLQIENWSVTKRLVFVR